MSWRNGSALVFGSPLELAKGCRFDPCGHRFFCSFCILIYQIGLCAPFLVLTHSPTWVWFSGCSNATREHENTVLLDDDLFGSCVLSFTSTLHLNTLLEAPLCLVSFTFTLLQITLLLNDDWFGSCILSFTFTLNPGIYFAAVEMPHPIHVRQNKCFAWTFFPPALETGQRPGLSGGSIRTAHLVRGHALADC